VTLYAQASDVASCNNDLIWIPHRELNVARCYIDLGLHLKPASVLFVGQNGTTPPSPLDPTTTTGTTPITTHTTSPPTTAPTITFLVGPCKADVGKCSFYPTTANCQPSVNEPLVVGQTKCIGNYLCVRCRLANNVEQGTQIALRFFKITPRFFLSHLLAVLLAPVTLPRFGTKFRISARTFKRQSTPYRYFVVSYFPQWQTHSLDFRRQQLQRKLDLLRRHLFLQDLR
jgi:hypothetical protein